MTEAAAPCPRAPAAPLARRDPAPGGPAPWPVPPFLADVYEDASRCNRCSLCQAACPTYQVHPVEWETARGRVALVRDAIEGRLELREIAEGPLSTCLTCNNCVAVCPPRVPTGEIVSRARQELHEQEGFPAGQALLLRAILPRPGGTRTLHRLARAGQVTGIARAVRRLGRRGALGTLGAMAAQAGPLPRRRADQRVGGLPAATLPTRGRLAFLICCYQNLVAPEATEAAMRVLLANGFELEVPATGCLGLPAHSLGDRHALTDMAVRTVTLLRDRSVDAVVGDVASCVGQVQDYGRILGDDRLLGEEARRLAASTHLASALLERRGWRAPLGPLPWRVAIDLPCSLPIGGSARGVAARLLARVPELAVLPLDEAAMCCGGPGAFATGEPRMSDAILERKFLNVVASGAGVLVTENVSCLVQLRRGALLHAPRVRVMHLMEVLDASIQSAATGAPRRPVG